MEEVYRLLGEIGEKTALENDRRIISSLIGSKITNFTIEPIPNRKTLYKMTIETDCDTVLLADPLLNIDGFDVLGKTYKAYADLSKIEVRVKLR